MIGILGVVLQSQARAQMDHTLNSKGSIKQVISSEDDDDNFLTLECDENLYDERLKPKKAEEEKVVMISKITKHMPTEPIKRHQSREKRIPSEKIDDTLPNFGFMEISDSLNEKPMPTNKDQKEPTKNKVSVGKTKETKSKPQKKLKIKHGKVKKNNENKNPYPPKVTKTNYKEHKLVEEMEEEDDNHDVVDIQMDQAVDHKYIPD